MRVAFVAALLFVAVASTWAAAPAAKPAAQTAAPAPGTRIGCFKDSRIRDLGDATLIGKTMTPQICIAHCKNKKYKYAGAQASAWCLCGQVYGKHGKEVNEKARHGCTLPCSGNKALTCGGHWRNEIFTTGL